MESPQNYIDDIYSVYTARNLDDTCLFGQLVLPAHLATMDSRGVFDQVVPLLSPQIGKEWALSIAQFDDGQSYYCLISEDDPYEMAACKKKIRFI